MVPARHKARRLHCPGGRRADLPVREQHRRRGSESPFVSLLRLRDVTFTAGGTRDVRGWGTLLVGPKLPQVRLEQQGDSTVAVADRYTPIGGLARLGAAWSRTFRCRF